MINRNLFMCSCELPRLKVWETQINKQKIVYLQSSNFNWLIRSYKLFVSEGTVRLLVCALSNQFVSDFLVGWRRPSLPTRPCNEIPESLGRKRSDLPGHMRIWLNLPSWMRLHSDSTPEKCFLCEFFFLSVNNWGQNFYFKSDAIIIIIYHQMTTSESF
jgi:hypothetical protein